MPEWHLYCADCGKESRGAGGASMREVRRLASEDGWLIGLRGSSRVLGWEDDYCADCAKLHPRIYCLGYRGKCTHKALYSFTREKDGKVIYTCGSHQMNLLKELVAGGHKVVVAEA